MINTVNKEKSSEFKHFKKYLCSQDKIRMELHFKENCKYLDEFFAAVDRSSVHVS